MFGAPGATGHTLWHRSSVLAPSRFVALERPFDEVAGYPRPWQLAGEPLAYIEIEPDTPRKLAAAGIVPLPALLGGDTLAAA